MSEKTYVVRTYYEGYTVHTVPAKNKKEARIKARELDDQSEHGRMLHGCWIKTTKVDEVIPCKD